MIAGNATPSDASTMWKPRVKAIWLRAAPRSEADSRRWGLTLLTSSPWSDPTRRCRVRHHLNGVRSGRGAYVRGGRRRWRRVASERAGGERVAAVRVAAAIARVEP